MSQTQANGTGSRRHHGQHGRVGPKEGPVSMVYNSDSLDMLALYLLELRMKGY